MANLSQNATLLIASAIVAVGIATAGAEVAEFRLADRSVSVKGLAERQVRADLAIWPIRFVATGNDLAEVRAKTAKDEQAVLAFLAKQGLPAETVVSRGVDVVDLLAQAFRQGPVDSRYIVTRTLTVRTADVDAVDRASQNVAELLDQGVALGGEPGMPGAGGPSYSFTRLNDIKTDMIAEATRNAREAAQQFAADSGASLGGIRRANQGVFQIQPRDDVPGLSESRQIDKTVRVVSTIDWALE